MGHPTKEQMIANKKRNEEIVRLSKTTYSVQYLAKYFGLSEARISSILKKSKKVDFDI